MRSLEKIPLTRIDWEDTTFLVNFLPDLEPLVASIKLVGLLEPLILREKADETYQIVCGFKGPRPCVSSLSARQRPLSIGRASSMTFRHYC